jgi:hypothetical protein
MPVPVLVAVLVAVLVLIVVVVVVLVAALLGAPLVLAARALVQREALRRRAVGSWSRVAEFLARRAVRRRGVRRRLGGVRGRLVRLGSVQRACGLPMRDFAGWSGRSVGPEIF